MKKIAVNDEVMFISEDGSAELGRIGKVMSVYELSHGDYAIVEFSDMVEKIPVENLVKVKREPVEEPKDEKVEKAETENEIREGALKISKAKMNEALVKVTDPNRGCIRLHSEGVRILAGLAIILVGKRMIDDLYGDSEEIVITKEQFDRAALEVLELDRLIEISGGRMDKKQLMPIGLLGALTFKHMPTILFGESENV